VALGRRGDEEILAIHEKVTLMKKKQSESPAHEESDLQSSRWETTPKLKLDTKEVEKTLTFSKKVPHFRKKVAYNC